MKNIYVSPSNVWPRFTHLPVAAAIVWATILAIWASSLLKKRGTFDARENAPTAVFVVLASLQSVTMQFAHRWSHTPAFAVPGAAKILQAAGFLIPPAKHSLHHVAPHDTNFSIMMGWADKLVNPLLRASPEGPWSPVWLPVFAAWLLSPLFLTAPRATRAAGDAWTRLCLAAARREGAPRDEARLATAVDAARGASRVACGLLVAGVCHHWAAPGKSKLFALHPLLMSVAAFGLVPEGVLAYRGRRAAHHAAHHDGDDRVAARRFHAKTMGTAFGLFGLATVVAAWRRRDLGLTHPLSRPAANPHAVLGYLAVAAFSSQALSGVVKLAGPHPKLLADLLKGHGASGKYLFLLAAAATITGAAHVHSGSLLLDLGLYAGVAATFAVFAALAAPAPPPAAPGALSPE